MNNQKHDSHVLKFKMQHFPWKVFVLSIAVFFLLGFIAGEMWGFKSCYLFNRDFA